MQRKLWMDAIRKVQHVDENSKGFQICIDHFKKTQIVQNKGKCVLAAGTAPSIFIEKTKEPICNTCTQLKKDISKSNIDSDFQQQSMQQTINKLKEKLDAERKVLKDTRKELRQKTLENEKLQCSLTNLKSDICSTMKGPNVSFLVIPIN